MTARPAEESKLSTLLLKLTYAVLQDYDTERGLVSNPAVVQSYANIILPTKSAVTKLIARASIHDHIKQYVSFIFKQIMTELKLADLRFAETYEQIMAAVTDANANSYTDFAFTLGKNMKQCFGLTLHGATDPAVWTTATITQAVPQIATRPLVAAIIIESYNTFLRAIAYMIGMFASIKGTNPDAGVIATNFAIMGMSVDLLEPLRACIREKKINAAKKVATDTTEPTPEVAVANAEITAASLVAGVTETIPVTKPLEM